MDKKGKINEMIKAIRKRLFLVLIFVLSVPMFASAYSDGYYESNNDDSTHTYYYYSDDYEREYSNVESCTWEDSGYDYINYGKNGHYHNYECSYCYGTKSEWEDCSWKRTGRDYINWSSKKHKVMTDYHCSKCSNDKTVVSYKNHSYKWVRYGSNFRYECKQCGHTPKYNGDVLIDSNDLDNITIRKDKTYIYRMFSFNKTRNKVKSIKYSKKKICTVKRSGRKLIIKGKKKGKCTVTVTMTSGAKYVLKVKVK